MSNLFNIVLLVVAGIALVYLLVKRNKGPKIKKIVVVDPEAQKLYNIQKHITTEEKTLTMQEKIELSWQFLVNIKNQVLKKFSKPDQEKVMKVGTILTEHGMKYQHDIELEIKVKQEFTKSKSVTKPKEQESMSR
jgi:hypothetical protein